MDPSKVPKTNEHQPRAPSMQDVDVDWSSVDPAAAASLQMALAMGLRAEEIHAALGGDDGARRMAAAAQVAQRATEAMQLTAALGDVIEDASKPETAEEAQRWEELLAAAAAGTATAADGEDVGHEGAEVGGGMEHAYTAEDSWGGENSEWALDKIVRRRKARVGGSGGKDGGADPDYQGDDKAWEYLCVWRGYAEATWERRGFLRDQGFGRDIETFDAQRAPQKKQRKLIYAPTAATSIETARTFRCETKEVAQQVRNFILEFTALVKQCQFPGIAQLFLLVASAIRRKKVQQLNDAVEAVAMDLFGNAHSAGLDVRWITLINPASLEPHLELVQNQPCSGGVPPLQIVYHGTAPEAVAPISLTGLVIPGQGNSIGVRNGQALGLGVYSAKELQTPSFYSRDGDYFMCSALDLPTSEIRVSGTVRVFFDTTYLTPFLHVSAQKQYLSGHPNMEINSFNSLVRFDGPGLDVRAY